MGGIQSISALPGDPTFSEKDNPYDEVAYRRICAEFDVDPSSDFRFTFGQNHGLGYVFINYPNGDYAQKKWVYPRQRYQTPPVKDLQMRGAQMIKATSMITSETTKVQTGSSSILYPIHRKDSPKRPNATEPVNRGFCVLRSRRIGECSQQYSWKRRASQGGAEGLPRSPGGCNQNARYFKEHSGLSASHR